MKKITLLIITLILFMIPAPVFSAITLDNGDKIRGDASTAAVVDYVISGMAGSTLSQLADGQLADATGDLYTASAAVIINSIILVNTDTSARTVNLFLLPSAGTARRIFPKDLSLAPGYAAFFDGTNIKVITTAGVTLSNGNIDLASPGPIGGTTPDELWGILDVNDYTDVTIDVPAISHYGGVIFNNDAGAIEYDLDPALVGMSITLVDAAGGAMSADPNGTETITYDGVTAAAGEILISSGTIGDFLTLICITAGEWMSVGHDSNGWVEATP